MRFEPHEFELGGPEESASDRSSFPPSRKKIHAWWSVSKQIAAIAAGASAIAIPSGQWMWEQYAKFQQVDALAAQHIEAVQNDVKSLQRTLHTETLRLRNAIVITQRDLLARQAALSKMPVDKVLDEYDRLVEFWQKADTRCDDVPEYCNTPEIAASKALSQRYR